MEKSDNTHNKVVKRNFSTKTHYKEDKYHDHKDTKGKTQFPAKNTFRVAIDTAIDTKLKGKVRKRKRKIKRLQTQPLLRKIPRSLPSPQIKKQEEPHVKPWPPIKVPSSRGSNQILIIDAFTFNFELDLLEIRLNELKHVVDYHILVESSHTVYGSPKAMYFDLHKWQNRFFKFRDKIIHVPVRDWVENMTGCDLGFLHLDNMRRKIVSPGLDMIVSASFFFMTFVFATSNNIIAHESQRR